MRTVLGGRVFERRVFGRGAFGSGVFERRFLPWLLVAPALAVVFGLLLYPIGRVVWLSFRDAGLPYLAGGQSRFTGFDNYRRMAADPDLRRIFVTTAVFGISCVVATMAAGLGVAALLTRRFRGRALLGVLVLLPWAIPRVAAGIVWRWMFHDQYGIVNWALAAGGAHGPAADRFYAFDKKTGELVWASSPGERPKDNSYSHPYLGWLGGKRVFYAATGDGTDTISGLEPASGDCASTKTSSMRPAWQLLTIWRSSAPASAASKRER